MSIEQMKYYIIHSYPNGGLFRDTNWSKKVKNMSDNQIIAVYHALLSRAQKKGVKV